MEAFLRNAAIPYSSPSSETFSALQASFSGVHHDRKPIIVVLPDTSQQLADAVKHALFLKLPVVVRGRGHDVHGRWTVAGAVLLDLRNLDSVTVDATSQTARVSGGATTLGVLKVLKNHGFQAPIGTCPTVGYVGWALCGGFGPFMSSYGFGADQIVGAKIIDADGELVEANERVLKGLRGGGGSLAIVAELVIKIYAATELQAGMLIHDSDDISQAIRTFLSNFTQLLQATAGVLPTKLGLIPGVWPLPGLGPTSAVVVVWNGPVDNESREWIKRIARLAPLMPEMPDEQTALATTTAHDFLASLDTMASAAFTGKCHTASVSSFTDEVIGHVGESIAKLPAGFNGGLLMNMVGPQSPSCGHDAPDSVLPYRKPHVVLEMLGYGTGPKSSAKAAQWALDVRNRLFSTKALFGGGYLAHTAPEFLDLDKTYGHHLAELRQIKTEVDPRGVFKHTVPRLI